MLKCVIVSIISFIIGIFIGEIIGNLKRKKIYKQAMKSLEIK